MTTAEKIKFSFDRYFVLPLKAWNSFVELGETLALEKNQIIKQNGKTEKYLHFILSGSGGVLLWNKNNFVCIDLCYDSEFFGDYMSFLTEQPSPLEVIIFEKSELFRISKLNFDRLNYNSDFGDIICRFASEGLFIHKQQQQIDILTKTAKERYQELQRCHPNIIQRTPQKYIASYLGVTPQSLSRIRSEIASH